MENPYLAHRKESKENPYTGKSYTENYFKILEKREQLPVFQYKKDLLEALRNNQVTLLVGETGSGKTTQVPQFFVEELKPHLKNKMIVCTQPRRVAAMSVAKRVAEEMDVEFGREVGYTIRFDDFTTNNKTFLKYSTDGMLLREAMFDPLLTKYSCIILDETHERTCATDILMGLIKEIIPRRPDLRVLVMSATLDTERFLKYFEGSPLIKVPGRTFPVEILYSEKPELDYVDAAIRTVLQIHMKEDPGDILLFLTGEEEIEDVCRKLSFRGNEMVDYPILKPIPLYSSLPPNEQQRIFCDPPKPREPGKPPGRKVIVSTNIAETSLTIDGIVYVIDPGFCKQKIYNPRNRVESLQVTPISQASAEQRAGRAGRTRPGKCYRLYTKESYDTHLTKQTPPEMLRTNLTTVVLQLYRIGVANICKFHFMEPPAPETMMRALEILNYMGALDDEGDLTELGKMMSDFPVDPQLAKVLISSSKYKCVSQMLSIVSMLSIQNPFLRPADKKKEADRARQAFADVCGDHFLLLNVYDTYVKNQFDAKRWCRENFLNPRAMASAVRIREQLEKIMKRFKFEISELSPLQKEFQNNIQKSLISGFFMQVACTNKSTGKYEIIKENEKVDLHLSTCLQSKPTWVVFNEYIQTTTASIRTVTEISNYKWLLEIAPAYYDLDTLPAGAARDYFIKEKYENKPKAKKQKRHK
ncbi:Helicase-associated domain-containing protein [Rozella allomycis CSF55]|uniref:RNA helicase n=1 Tax=Rozella allomycis (strain CSF55) TaxID=988480 RepID=A0A075ATB3_ROZAC|nr:Helicase-associated domain-containing protein [Rozella allomycis CSF55]|eukprot:EPZ33410.1 Helicase-associated domain-containing protein [Rozella allomycis CSF55]